MNISLKGFSSLAVLVAAAVAPASINSHFDTGTDGWISVNVSFPALGLLGTHNPTWTGSSIVDTEFQGAGLFLFAAPAAYQGDLSSYYGGTVKYQLSDSVSDGVPYPNLILRGSGTILYYTTAAPGTTLTNYSISLTPAGWLKGSGGAPTAAEFQSVLSNVDVFAINADWKTAGTDTAGLDEVSVSAVPEPGTLACLAFGAAALMRRRRTTR